MNVIRVLISMGFALVCGCYVSAQEPVEGPITDAITNRVEKLFQRQAEEASAMEARLNQRFSERVEELSKSLRELREDRDGILPAIKEFRKEHGTILEGMRLLTDSVSESVGKWTPLQNLVDRLTALVWKLFWFICVLGGLILLLALVGLFLYSRLKGFVAREISSLIAATFKQ